MTYTVKLHLKSGHGLLASDRNGKSDPYVVATLGRKTLRSKVIKKSLDPVWDEVLSFEAVPLETLQHGQLHLKCFDEDRVPLLGTIGDPDDKLGTADVSLTPLVQQGTGDFRAPLATQGTLVFSVHVINEQSEACCIYSGSSSAPPQVPPLQMTPAASPQAPGSAAAASCYTVDLHLKSAYGLLAADVDGKSDPYVVALLGRMTRMSKVVSDTLDPVWDEVLRFEAVPAETLRTEQLRLQVYDQDAPGRVAALSDDLGVAHVSLEPLLASQSACEFEEVVIEPQGRLSFSVKATPDTLITVEVHLKSGHCLLPADHDGMSDPYVVGTLGGKKAKSSVKKNTLDPQWDEVLLFRNVPAQTIIKEQLRLKVYDQDPATAVLGINALSDELGVLRVSLAPLMKQPSIDFREELDRQGALVFSVRVTDVGPWRSRALGAIAGAVSSAARACSSLGSQTARAVCKPGEFFQKQGDAIVEYTLDKALDAIGKSAREALKDPDMSEHVKASVDRTFDSLWKPMAAQIRHDQLASLNLQDKQFRERQVKFRAWSPSFWPRGAFCPQPYAFFRAKMLYTIAPSDGTLWSTINDWHIQAIRIGMLLPVVSVGIVAAYFIFIPWRDEFQLVQFITMVKSLQAIAMGAMLLITAGIKFYACLMDIDSKTYRYQAFQEPIDPTELCIGSFPASDLLTQATLVLEPIRITLCFLA